MLGKTKWSPGGKSSRWWAKTVMMWSKKRHTLDWYNRTHVTQLSLVNEFSAQRHECGVDGEQHAPGHSVHLMSCLWAEILWTLWTVNCHVKEKPPVWCTQSDIKLVAVLEAVQRCTRTRPWRGVIFAFWLIFLWMQFLNFITEPHKAVTIISHTPSACCYWLSAVIFNWWVDWQPVKLKRRRWVELDD